MNLTDLPAHALSAAIHAKQASCREVMQAYLSRIAECNPRYNAIVSLRMVTLPLSTLMVLAKRVAVFRNIGVFMAK